MMGLAEIAHAELDWTLPPPVQMMDLTVEGLQ